MFSRHVSLFPRCRGAKVPGAAALSICKRLRVRGARGPFRETCIELVKSPVTNRLGWLVVSCEERQNRIRSTNRKFVEGRRKRNERSPDARARVLIVDFESIERSFKLRLRIIRYVNTYLNTLKD